MCGRFATSTTSASRALGYYPNPLSNNAEEAEVAQPHLKQGHRCGPIAGPRSCQYVHRGRLETASGRELARFREVWPELIRHAEDRGVRIGIENCPMLFTMDEWPFGKNLARSPHVWRQMFEAIPSPNFGLNYDPSHMVLQRMDCYAPIKEFADRIFHTHAKDMKIEYDQLNDRGVLTFDWYTAKIPGLGDVDWSRWISALTDAGYDGPVCIEVEDEAFMASLETRKQSLRISRNVLRPLIG